MITVTERAATKALFLAQKDGKPPLLRVGVKGGGCTGFTYFMDFIPLEQRRDNDLALEMNGLTVVCDPKSLKVIEGTELDFDTNILMGGFKFNNPKAKKTCSCGESFSV